jgi:hypothetical protein
MAQPYKIPNKSSAVDILLSGIKGALSAGLTLEQQAAQKQQAAREWQMKVSDLQIKKDQLDQQWKIALMDSKDKYDTMIANQSFDANQAVLANKAKEDLANTDMKRQILMKFMDLQIKQTDENEQRKWETEEKAKDREVQREGHRLEAEKLGQSIAYQNANLSLAIGKAGWDKNKDILGILQEQVKAEKGGGTAEEKQSVYNQQFRDALNNYLIDKNNKTNTLPVSAQNLRSASILSAVNQFKINGSYNSPVYDYDPDKKDSTLYETDLYGFVSNSSPEEVKALFGNVKKTGDSPLSALLNRKIEELVESEAPTKSETGAPVKKVEKPLSQKTIAPIIPVKPSTQAYSLPGDPATFISNVSNMDDASALKLLKSIKADAVKRYGGTIGDDIDTMISRLTPKGSIVKPNPVLSKVYALNKESSVTDIYNKLTKIVKVDTKYPDRALPDIDEAELDRMVSVTNKETLLSALTIIFDRAGAKNPRTRAKNLLIHYKFRTVKK